MSLLTRLAARLPFQWKSVSSEDIWRQVYGGSASKAGVSVTWANALDVATVLACVRVIANGVAQVPFRLYRDDGAGRSLAREHPLFAVIHRRPNPWQTSFGLRETMMFHLLLTGNAYVWKGRVGIRREVRVLEPIEPRRVQCRKDARSGEVTYLVTADDGAQQRFSSEDIWHVRGPSWNAVVGMDAVKLARDAIGLAIATETAQAEYHKGSTNASGLLAMKETIGKEKFEFLSAWLDKHGPDGDRAGKALILDGEAKYTRFGMTGVDAQHLETRKHQIEEICRAFGVMPIMVAHADKTSTYASAEQMFLAHVVHTLAPWYERLEQSADLNLLSEADLGAGYYCKFTPNALMRGAAKDRAEFYTKALGAGGHGTAWMTANEVRRLEEMDPVTGGDELPAGAVPAAAVPAPASADESEADTGADSP